MGHKRYKILVLTDLKDATEAILKSALGLANIISGDVELLCVKKPTEVVKQDNQLAAMRTIHSEQTDIDKQLQAVTSTLFKQYKIPVNYRYAIGHVKTEIGNYIKTQQPDVIVLGKQKQRPFNPIGDQVTKFVLKNHKGAILIAGHAALAPKKTLHLGVFNGKTSGLKVPFAQDLISYSQQPLRLFNVLDKNEADNKAALYSHNDAVEFAFEENDHTIKSISKYLLKSKVDLLYADREEHKQGAKKGRVQLQELLKTINVPLLVSGTENYAIT
ncbi:hypothetical protein IA57_05970 [Mangrovimonas yunxiaonensis]|uniref:UspA domain-containing protein n=1 Tax=Mangrovimonas yunxiaonensis TaxID=1197477 RepID=A0A084TKY6_9FLAO|nr:universal stress protein [Mangrovimonas yunxiaonensis]KFB01372.1 hypothetical protein IA57_05970 [Mangrovimonas yunxiaonensis]GGH37070.1 hypothetical protein GCM10011364_04790 [Mangrovimonas yunxiaonensis]